MLPDPGPFLQKLLTGLAKLPVPVEQLELDHLCYRVAGAERYVHVRQQLAEAGVLLGEHLIAGRPIATFRLHEPYHHAGRRIDVVELPAPKPGKPYSEGWEHAEFVVPEDLGRFADRYPDAPWDRSALHKPHQEELRIRLGAISAKFHRRALAEVIEEEGRNSATATT